MALDGPSSKQARISRTADRISGSLRKASMRRHLTRFAFGGKDSWCLRFFAVSSGQLMYWVDGQSYALGTNPRGTFSLYYLVRVVSQGVFVMLHFSRPQRASSGRAREELLLQADSTEEAETWAESIREEAAMVMKGGPCAFPKHWDVSPMLAQQSMERVFVAKFQLNGDAVRQQFQQLFDYCWIPKATLDCTLEERPTALEVLRVVRVQNGPNWRNYKDAQEKLRSGMSDGDIVPNGVIHPNVRTNSIAPSLPVLPALDKSVNECWLFHGSSEASLHSIAEDDFRVDLAGSRGGTLYGPGVYAAECTSKADEYASKVDDCATLGLPEGCHAMLLCRATLGKICYDDSPRPSVTSPWLGTCNSILGDQWRAVGTYREFVLPDNTQMYPNFIVYYRRLDEPSLVE